MLVEKAALKNLHCIRLNSGDDVLESIRNAAAKQGVKNAIILAGTGSTVNYHYHIVTSVTFPPENVSVKGEGSSDVCNVNGLIINGRVHAHITHSNTEGTHGGHLEEGVKVNTFMAITFAEIDLDLDKWDSLERFEENRKISRG